MHKEGLGILETGGLGFGSQRWICKNETPPVVLGEAFCFTLA